MSLRLAVGEVTVLLGPSAARRRMTNRLDDATDRFTDGLAAAERRAVLTRLPALAASGVAVLVDDADPVARMAVADGALRVDRSGDIRVEQLAYLAS